MTMSNVKPEIPMHHGEAHGALPAWVWRAIAGTRRDAGDSLPATILREGKPSGPFSNHSQRDGLVVLDLQDWRSILEVLDSFERNSGEQS